VNETMVTVTGNVAGEVISRRVGIEEHLLVTFRVASSERRWDKASESWVDGDRFTASVNCWRRLAQGAQSSLVKGDPVVVTGRLSVREYETEGGRRYMTEIAATAVGPDLSRCTAEVRRRRPSTENAGDGTATGEVGSAATELAGAPAEGDVARIEPDEDLPGSAGTATGPSSADGVEGSVSGPGKSAEGAANSATVTGIGSGDRRRAGASRASA
jgi:single-strand DNA-binding protein